MIGELQTSTIRGLRTGWWKTGDAEKPLLIFLHGFPDSPETWEYQAEYFREDFEVVCPYTRGAGPSEPGKNLRRYGLESSALDHLALLREWDPEGRRPIYLVGHDLGAAHAANLATYLGPRLSGLVLINGLPLSLMARRLENPRQLLKSWYIAVFQIPGIPELALRYFPNTFLHRAHQSGEISDERALSLEQVHDCLSDPLQQYRAFLRDVPRALRDPVRPISCPLLVVWGERDAFLVPPRADEFRPFAAHFTCRILPGNHWIHRTSPDRVNRLLGEFFDRTRSASS